jgi:hypothetical protein
MKLAVLLVALLPHRMCLGLRCFVHTLHRDEHVYRYLPWCSVCTAAATRCDTVTRAATRASVSCELTAQPAFALAISACSARQHLPARSFPCTVPCCCLGRQKGSSRAPGLNRSTTQLANTSQHAQYSLASLAHWTMGAWCKCKLCHLAS